jgi:hypothetical protein
VTSLNNLTGEEVQAFERFLRTGLIYDDYPLEGVSFLPELDARIDELWQATAREPVESEVRELYANPAASQAMLDDKNFDVIEWMANAVAAEFARTGLDAFIDTPSNVLRDPYTHKPYVHFYVTRKAAELARSGELS